MGLRNGFKEINAEKTGKRLNANIGSIQVCHLAHQSYCIKTTSDFGLRTSDFGLRTSDFGLRTSDFGLRTSEFGIRNSDFGIPFTLPLHQQKGEYPDERCRV